MTDQPNCYRVVFLVWTAIVLSLTGCNSLSAEIAAEAFSVSTELEKAPAVGTNTMNITVKKNGQPVEAKVLVGWSRQKDDQSGTDGFGEFQMQEVGVGQFKGKFDLPSDGRYTFSLRSMAPPGHHKQHVIDVVGFFETGKNSLTLIKAEYSYF